MLGFNSTEYGQEGRCFPWMMTTYVASVAEALKSWDELGLLQLEDIGLS